MKNEGQISSHAVQLKAIGKRIAPKPPQTVKIVSVALALAITAAGGLWALADRISARPTDHEMLRSIETHEKNGHRETAMKVVEIRIEQSQQKILLEGVKETQKEQGKKLDALLERTPEKQRYRR